MQSNLRKLDILEVDTRAEFDVEGDERFG